jgi:hypothetical protein
MFFELFEYIIFEDEEGLCWAQIVDEDTGLFMVGRCYLDETLSVVILQSYESVEPLENTDASVKWDKSEFYMTVSESGVTEIYNVSDGKPSPDDVKKRLGTGIGCTMRFR